MFKICWNLIWSVWGQNKNLLKHETYTIFRENVRKYSHKNISNRSSHEVKKSKQTSILGASVYSSVVAETWALLLFLFLRKKDDLIDDDDTEYDKDIYYAGKKDETVMTSTYDTDISETD